MPNSKVEPNSEIKPDSDIALSSEIEAVIVEGQGSFGTFALSLAKALLGAELSTSIKEQLMQEMKGLLIHFVEVIALIIRRELRANDKEKLESDAGALQIFLHDYFHEPSKAKLAYLNQLSIHLVQEATRLKVAAVPVYAIVGSISLIVYQEIYKGSRSRGDKANLVDHAVRLVSRIDEDFRTALKADLEARFSKIMKIHMGGGAGHPPGHIRGFFYYYLFDNQREGLSHDWHETLRQRTNKWDAEYNRLDNLVIAPLVRVGEEWSKVETKYKD